MRADRVLLKGVLKQVVLILLICVGCRLGGGIFAGFLALIGVWCALTNRLGASLFCYAIFPFLIIANPFLVPKVLFMGQALRVGTAAMSVCLVIASGRRSGRAVLPMAGLYVYLLLAILSSASGWMPLISYFKILNMFLFLVGLHLGTRNLHTRPRDVMFLRQTFLAICFILTIGSVLVIPFPSISYVTSLKTVIAKEGVAAAEAAYQNAVQSGGLTLFSGVTNHSQAFAPVLSCATGYVLCDMIFIERRLTSLHGVMLASSPILLFMSRSRAGLLSYASMVAIVVLFAQRKIVLPAKIRNKVRGLIWMGVLGVILLAAIAEVKSQSMTKWIRKTNDLAGDSRGVSEAFTSTRQGLVDMSMDDFRRNPLLGMGFQVAEYTKAGYESGWMTWYSAPVEKGVLPVMILGEGGVVGAIAFVLFLLNFYMVCKSRYYILSMSLFTVYLVTNLAEASFFSPGGIGAIEWMLTLVGGFTMDSLLLHRRTMEQMQMLMFARGEPPPMRYR